MPSSEASCTPAVSISSSVTAMAVPWLSRTAWSTRKSPSALGTRRPAATVWALSKKRLRGSFSSKARTMGAQPVACTAIILGRREPIQEIAERFRNAEAGGQGVGVVEEAAARFVFFEGAHDGGATGGLHGNHLGAPRADPAELLHFIEGLPHADHADPAAGGIEDGVG